MELEFNFTLLLLIFMRMTGCVVFNPILGRTSVPIVIRVGLALMLSIFSYQLVPVQNIELATFLIFFVTMLREFLLGFLVGFVIQMFLSVILISGENIDMQIGISMSKIYDPQSNVSMPVSGSLINAMFFLLFFVTNAHLTLMQVFVQLCVMVPYGTVAIDPQVFSRLVELFRLILIYAIKMSLPVMASQLITEFAVGLVMKAVPKLNIFMINIQVKVILGFGILLLMAGPLASFLERLITLMFDEIGAVFQLLL
ncbi:flagellar biosynthetic protein FliR [Clostridium minihomine]|uniref:flagellar biosynthetic protein FliR n=1 Tax=Clostridium minihomine TaxID=2045012 RepID=UPI000C77D661|nr:flagellar biosynthetic protein FliR [Clostridium minihomine]